MATLTPKQRLQIEQEIQEIQSNRSNLRSRERSLQGRVQSLKAQPLVSTKAGGGLRSNLQKIIPKELMPQNIGQFQDVMWNYFFPVDFDFGVNPIYTSNSKLETNVQVDQEAGFLLTHISRDHNDPDASGYSSPTQITIKDLSSSRQFNDNFIPVQQIGFKSKPTRLDTPLYFAANSRIQIVMTSWIPVGLSHTTVGSGKHQFMLGGFRIREKDASKVLASIFI